MEIKDILKPNAELEIIEIDGNDPEVITFIEEAKKAQEKVLKLKKIDYRRLEETIITI